MGYGMWGCLLDLFALWWVEIAVYCEHDNENMGYGKGGGIIDQMNDFQHLLK
jgi:hypothetical protein